jgi:hypothetical protein
MGTMGGAGIVGIVSGIAKEERTASSTTGEFAHSVEVDSVDSMATERKGVPDVGLAAGLEMASTEGVDSEFGVAIASVEGLSEEWAIDTGFAIRVRCEWRGDSGDRRGFLEWFSDSFTVPFCVLFPVGRRESGGGVRSPTELAFSSSVCCGN